METQYLILNIQPLVINFIKYHVSELHIKHTGVVWSSVCVFSYCVENTKSQLDPALSVCRVYTSGTMRADDLDLTHRSSCSDGGAGDHRHDIVYSPHEKLFAIHVLNAYLTDTIYTSLSYMNILLIHSLLTLARFTDDNKLQICKFNMIRCCIQF
jgi:hypothetical protein